MNLFYFLIFFFKSASYQTMTMLPVHPSFVMTTTQDIRDLFAKHSPITMSCSPNACRPCKLQLQPQKDGEVLKKDVKDWINIQPLQASHMIVRTRVCKLSVILFEKRYYGCIERLLPVLVIPARRPITISMMVIPHVYTSKGRDQNGF